MCECYFQIKFVSHNHLIDFKTRLIHVLYGFYKNELAPLTKKIGYMSFLNQLRDQDSS